MTIQTNINNDCNMIIHNNELWYEKEKSREYTHTHTHIYIYIYIYI